MPVVAHPRFINFTLDQAVNAASKMPFEINGFIDLESMGVSSKMAYGRIYKATPHPDRHGVINFLDGTYISIYKVVKIDCHQDLPVLLLKPHLEDTYLRYVVKGYVSEASYHQLVDFDQMIRANWDSEYVFYQPKTTLKCAA